MSTLFYRVGAWAQRTMPTREQLENYRLVRPFARRTELWRFTRRSVPRGVAVGLFVGIFALIPGIQIVGAAMMCVPVRANIPVAAAMTFLSNPATTPLIIAASIVIGNHFGFHADLSTFHALYRGGAGAGQWLHWLLSDAAPALLFGLLIISLVAAITGYAIALVAWRLWIGRKWRLRALARALVQVNPRVVQGPARLGGTFEWLTVAAALGVSLLLVWVITRQPLLVAGYVGALLVLGALAVLLARRRPAARQSELAGPDWSVTVAAIDRSDTAIAVTDRAGRLVCANRCHEDWFGIDGAPPPDRGRRCLA